MPEKQTDKPAEKNVRDGLSLILGGVFILAMVFIAYNYFSKPADETESSNSPNKSIIERIKEAISPSDEGELNGDGAYDEDLIIEDEMEYDVLKWVANDYKEGDITGDTYEVKWGDTLWEISEAVYGDGTQWTKILDANSSDIGYLPNGQQALIHPAQVLVIP